jgi:2-iminobutanoate/2-iminopropanoate deaminase
MTKQTIQSPDVATPVSPYSPALLVEGKRLLFMSGQIPEDAQGNLVGAGDFRAQAIQVFTNIEANLKAAGATWDNVVKLTVLVTDMANFAAYNEVRKQFLKAPYPASTMAAVKSLVLPEWLIEVEAIAVLD